MKFERMSDQQIRCTLTKEDLAARKIKISELAYGTEKARSLFKEVMSQAADELDFEAEDIPLMVEAVPISSECLIITITKVEDPEELDTRFAQFAPSLIDADSEEFAEESENYGDNGMLDLFKQLADTLSAKADVIQSSNEGLSAPPSANADLSRLFSFRSMDPLFKLSHVIESDFNGVNSLYKDSKTGRYLLLICQSSMDLMSFNRICNIISEYGESERNLLATNAFLEEHLEVLIADNAIKKLASI